MQICPRTSGNSETLYTEQKYQTRNRWWSSKREMLYFFIFPLACNLGTKTKQKKKTKTFLWCEAVSYEQWRMGRTLHTTGWAQGLEQNWFSYIKTWSHDVTKLQQNSRHSSKGTNLGWGHPKTVFHRFSSSVQSVAVMIETNKILSTISQLSQR